ncbi:zinc finger CCCH domain-containing protein 3 isoform X1 [Syngnathus acus]|uniref:zinc finger CCCH domain-containing protein 3 isoform X1 n=1 Tax=Syngnathus acus TaxID=161584 RepID=UPI0018863315|nr:zinc finger CCCH domain-containing protein 3 isoform X1 [Syngnathus acus]XP_037105225.1 zinc finger CCCH domain-containing protein 3 isoform X1 [Syngnathus acus]XP_037105226.1 zinc finger CCCH domain-containing protein 3 isoform X1 [Syngnathus acus]
MEQRESLKRQIDLLQNLIDKHKGVHGNTPRLPEVATTSRGRCQSSSVTHPHGLYARFSHGSWRETYSLKNRSPVSTVSTSSPEHHSDIHVEAHGASLPSEKSDASKPPTASSKMAPHKKKGQKETLSAGIENVATERRGGCKTTVAVPPSVLLVQSTQQQGLVKQSVVPPGPKARADPARFQNQPILNSQADVIETQRPDRQQQVGQSASSSPSKVPQQAFREQPLPRSRQATGGQTKSKFTWVKNQSFQSQPSGSVYSQANQDVDSTSGAKASLLGASSLASPLPKQTPAKKARKQNPVVAGPRASKYKWVSSSTGLQAKTLRKSTSPKTLSGDQRAVEKGEAIKKLKSGSFTTTKLKRGCASSSTSFLSSRYHWKAAVSRSPVAGARAEALRRSTFVWLAAKHHRGAKKGPLYSHLGQGVSIQSSPNSFKLRSRMKIIRKSANGSSPSGSSSPRGGLSLAAKHSARGHAPSPARRTSGRELVSFGRHKLRRLSPTSSRASAAFSSQRAPAWQRICRAQYKMLGHPGSNVAYQPSLSWRAKKIQSARSFLQSRQRSSLTRHPPAAHHWTRSGMCWIRGHLYQVSANKLSRTGCHNMSADPTGRSFSQVSSVNSAPAHPYSPRHLASRAVQRSLAIIRQARQKKQRQFCMYYNRFGKCNRGGSCPFIHDPDKVAVCTRFLRGTCKQADGACPFSHKVAKEKMPVCSYFLKGICNNSECPYSHVYVSHKAKVCEDFVKGYCPQGEKCKKKHTLVCPDFSKMGSCPRGARCKLRHRQCAKRRVSEMSTSTAPSDGPSTRPRLLGLLAHGSRDFTSTLALPSFISLSSSPEEPNAPAEAEPAKSAAVQEKKLQIKPRL